MSLPVDPEERLRLLETDSLGYVRRMGPVEVDLLLKGLALKSDGLSNEELRVVWEEVREAFGVANRRLNEARETYDEALGELRAMTDYMRETGRL